MTLRAARLDDPDALALVAEVQRFYVEIYGGEDTDPLDPDSFAPPDGGFVIAEVDGQPVGMGGWSRSSAATTASVRRMFVRPEQRRSGLAGEILSWIEDDARNHEIRRLILTTGPPQVAAIAFYRARGFTDIEPYGYWAEHGFDAVFLGKDLSSSVP